MNFVYLLEVFLHVVTTNKMVYIDHKVATVGQLMCGYKLTRISQSPSVCKAFRTWIKKKWT